MSGSPRSKTVAVIGERWVPPPLQNLHHRLLEKSVERGWDTKFSHPPSVRLLDFYAPYRLRFIGAAQQSFPDGEPVLFQVATELADGHPVDPRATFISLYSPQCFQQIFSLTYFLHQSASVSWVFGFMHRLARFGLFPSVLAGFTRRLRWKVQFLLDVLPLVVPEVHVLLASPLVRAFDPRFRLGLSVGSTFRYWSASLALPTTGPTTPYADFCSAVGLPLGSLSRRSDTEQISWGNLSCLPCTVAGSTPRILDGMWTSRYVARSSDARALYPILVHRLARLLDASFRPHLAVIALASLLTLHLHQVG